MTPKNITGTLSAHLWRNSELSAFGPGEALGGRGHHRMVMTAQRLEVAPLEPEMGIGADAEEMMDFLGPIATTWVHAVGVRCQEAGSGALPFAVISSER